MKKFVILALIAVGGLLLYSNFGPDDGAMEEASFEETFPDENMPLEETAVPLEVALEHPALADDRRKAVSPEHIGED